MLAVVRICFHDEFHELVGVDLVVVNDLTDIEHGPDVTVQVSGVFWFE